MLVVISPAKKLDYESPTRIRKHSRPDFVAESAKLIRNLRKFSATDLKNLMGINDEIAETNRARYKSWSRDFPPENSRQAILAFMGDVYRGLDARSLDSRDGSNAK